MVFWVPRFLGASFDGLKAGTVGAFEGDQANLVLRHCFLFELARVRLL